MEQMLGEVILSFAPTPEDELLNAVMLLLDDCYDTVDCSHSPSSPLATPTAAAATTAAAAADSSCPLPPDLAQVVKRKKETLCLKYFLLNSSDAAVL
jgi:hypothetical protein